MDAPPPPENEPEPTPAGEPAAGGNTPSLEHPYIEPIAAPATEAPAPVPAPAPQAAPEPAQPPGWLREHLSLLAADRTTLFATMAAAVVLTVSRYHLTTAEYHRVATGAWGREGGLFAGVLRSLRLERLAQAVGPCTAPTGEYLYWFLGALVLFFALPLAAGAALRIRPAALGAGAGDWRYGVKATALLYAVMLPFVVVASGTAAFSGHYPMSPGATASGRVLATYELAYAAYFVGWEFVYRGLLCVALHARVGAAAILLHTIPFAVMHAGKPEPEAYGSIVAGLALGVVAVRARSFWYGAALHAMVAFTMDMLALARTHRFPAAW